MTKEKTKQILETLILETLMGIWMGFSAIVFGVNTMISWSMLDKVSDYGKYVAVIGFIGWSGFYGFLYYTVKNIETLKKELKEK